jgi:carbonic anhydrase
MQSREMRLFEAIVQANQRGQRGDQIEALLTESHDSLPVAALTCIDARLNRLVPEAVGIHDEKFIWLRNAGNIITGPMSSTLRSLALACAVKGAKEIAIIGHSDCLVCKHTVMQLTDRFSALGISRDRLPENLIEYFGLFASERQNAMKAAEIVRSSPMIGAKIPVHGLMLDVANGRLEWVVNGYETLTTVTSTAPVVTATRDAMQKIGDVMESVQNVVREVKDLKLGEMKFPTAKIGELVSEAGQWLKETGSVGQGTEPGAMGAVASSGSPAATTPATATPPPITAMEMARRLDPSKRFKVIGRDQKLYGPVSVAELLAWLADNRIDHNTPVQREDNPVWKPLGAWLKHEIDKKIEKKLRLWK